ncbi:MAG: HD domain-containing phosphohydrolase [Candidatus Saccharicenans sp.]|nr:HD domain-containing phosphohydrolase [Candidatus Saccharicenans sp.]
MKEDRSKKSYAEEAGEIRKSSLKVQEETRVKAFDLQWLKTHWNLQGWGKVASSLMNSPYTSPYVISRIEAFIKASRILDRLENSARQEKLANLNGLKKIFSDNRFFNSELIYFLAAADSREENIGHSQFVAAYTVMLAEAAGVNDRRALLDIERGALLHDLGKVGIPDEILLKEGPLTEEEMEIVKYHPLIGFAMIEEFSFLQGASEVVLFHHERYDGIGYPFGLEGEAIPLGARLFSIADTVDAITSDRPYRKGSSFQVALDEVRNCIGSQFDPALVEIALEIPPERWMKVKEKVQRSLKLPVGN